MIDSHHVIVYAILDEQGLTDTRKVSGRINAMVPVPVSRRKDAAAFVLDSDFHGSRLCKARSERLR